MNDGCGLVVVSVLFVVFVFCFVVLSPPALRYTYGFLVIFWSFYGCIGRSTFFCFRFSIRSVQGQPMRALWVCLIDVGGVL